MTKRKLIQLLKEEKAVTRWLQHERYKDGQRIAELEGALAKWERGHAVHIGNFCIPENVQPFIDAQHDLIEQTISYQDSISDLLAQLGITDASGEANHDNPYWNSDGTAKTKGETNEEDHPIRTS